MPESILKDNIKYRRYHILLFAGFTTGLIIIYLAYSVAPSICFGMSFLFCICTMVCLLNRKHGLLSWRFLIPLFYLFMFVIMPTFEQVAGFRDYVRSSSIGGSALIAAMGVLFFHFGASFTRHKGARCKEAVSQPGQFRIFKNTPSLIFTFVILMLSLLAKLWSLFFGYFGLLSMNVTIPAGIAGMISTAGYLQNMAGAIIWYQIFIKKTERKGWIAFGIIYLVIALAIALFENSKGSLIFPFIIVGVAYVATTKKIPYAYCVVIVVLFLTIVFPFVSAMRVMPVHNLTSRTAYVNGVIANVRSGAWLKYLDVVPNVALSPGRGLFYNFDLIVENSGRNVEFEHGETYLNAVQQLVPRFIWESKPNLMLGNEFGYRYNLINLNDYVTNVSPTQMGEMFMNFGLLFVPIGMFIWGYIAFLVDVRIVGSDTWAAVWVFPFILWQEGFLSHTVVPFMKFIVLLSVILILWNLLSKIFLNSLKLTDSQKVSFF